MLGLLLTDLLGYLFGPFTAEKETGRSRQATVIEPNPDLDLGAGEAPLPGLLLSETQQHLVADVPYPDMSVAWLAPFSAADTVLQKRPF